MTGTTAVATGPRETSEPGPVANHSEDLQLVARMLAGDEGAFEAFGERYFRALYRFTAARLGGDRELVREIVQTAVAHALSRLAGYRGEAALLTWLCACCRNEMRMHFRRRRSAAPEVELDEALEPAAGFSGGRPDDPEEALLGRERALSVHMALDGLPERYARALEWKYLDRLSVEDVAARLGLGTKAAESLLARARQAFRTGYARIELRLPARPGGAADGEERP